MIGACRPDWWFSIALYMGYQGIPIAVFFPLFFPFFFPICMSRKGSLVLAISPGSLPGSTPGIAGHFPFFPLSFSRISVIFFSCLVWFFAICLGFSLVSGLSDASRFSLFVHLLHFFSAFAAVVPGFTPDLISLAATNLRLYPLSYSSPQDSVLHWYTFTPCRV